MTPRQFSRLKVGQTVKLLATLPDYSCGHKTLDGRAYIPAGTIGVVGAVKVPGVFQRTGGGDWYFACIDFNYRPEFVDFRGKPVEHRHRKDLPQHFRCAAEAEDIDYV
jgi:hypothetical protein